MNDKKRMKKLLNLLEKGEVDTDLWDKALKSLNTGAALIGNTKVRRWVLGGTSVVSLLKVAHDWYTENRGSDTYTIRIYESDILYDRIHKWVTSTVDETELRSIIAAAAPNEAYGQSSPLSNDDEVDVSYDIFHPKNSLSASGQTSLDIIYDGSRV